MSPNYAIQSSLIGKTFCCQSDLLINNFLHFEILQEMSCQYFTALMSISIHLYFCLGNGYS